MNQREKILVKRCKAFAKACLVGASIFVAQGSARAQCVDAFPYYTCDVVDQYDRSPGEVAQDEQIAGQGNKEVKSQGAREGGGGPGSANPNGNNSAKKQKAISDKCKDPKKMEQAKNTAATSPNPQPGNANTPQSFWQKLRSSFSSLKNLGNSFKNFLTKSFLGQKGSSGGGIQAVAARVAQPIVDLFKSKESSAVKEAWEAACRNQSLRERFEDKYPSYDWENSGHDPQTDIDNICRATCAENNKVVTILTNAVNSFTGPIIHRQFTIRRVPGNPTISGNGRLDCNCRPAQKESQG